MLTVHKKNKKRRNWIPIVTGLIRKNEKVLIGLRPVKVSGLETWEFPGGHIDQAESPEQALKRALVEKIGIDADISNFRFAHTHSHPERGVLLLFYDIDFWKGEPKSAYYSDLRWITASDLETISVSEAIQSTFPKIQEAICTRVQGK